MSYKEKYIKLILEVLSEAERLVVLKEAVPYNVVKKYLQIERDPTAENRLNRIFRSLETLPKALRLDKRGDRIALPYDPDSRSESPIEKELSQYIKKYNFNIKDYTKGIAFDEKNKRDVKLGKVISLAIKKEKNPSIQKKIQDTFNKFNTDPKRAQASKDSSYLVVFAKHKYDIASMSTGRDWRSCMNIIDGMNKHYVNLDIEEGTFIAYLIDNKDINIKKPFGRVLVKPYIKIDTEEEVGVVVTDGEDVINYAEDRSYGQIPEGEDKFIDFVDDIMEKVQKISGSYKRLGCLYSDSNRNTVIDKKTMFKKIQNKLNNKKELSDSEFKGATKEQKNKHIDILIDRGKTIERSYLKAATDDQINRYLEKRIEDDKNLFPDEFKLATDDQKKKYIDKKIENNKDLYPNEFEAATDDQKHKYIEKMIEIGNPLDTDVFNAATDDQIRRYIDKRIEFNNLLYAHELKAATDDQKHKYIEKMIEIGEKMYSKEFKLATDDQIRRYIDKRIEDGRELGIQELEAATDDQKQKYIYNKLENNKHLYPSELELATDDQIRRYIDKRIEDGRELEIHELKAATDDQKQKYIDNKLEKGQSLYMDELELATDEQKEKHIDIRIKNGRELRIHELKAATDDQKQKYISSLFDKEDYSEITTIARYVDIKNQFTPKQQVLLGKKLVGYLDPYSADDFKRISLESINSISENLPTETVSFFIKALKEKEQYLNDDVRNYLAKKIK